MDEKRIKVGSNSKIAKFELINGCEGPCLGINDYRAHGPKPWGGGYVISTCYPNKERVRKLIEGKEYVDIYLVELGGKGFWIDGVNLSRKGTKKDYQNHLKHMKILQKRKSNKSYREYKYCIFKNVETDQIKKALDYPYIIIR